MKSEELNRMYRKQAEQLETEQKWKEAERLYLTINEAALAISMYTKLKMYPDVVRLVRAYKPEDLESIQLTFARVGVAIALDLLAKCMFSALRMPQFTYITVTFFTLYTLGVGGRQTVQTG